MRRNRRDGGGPWPTLLLILSAMGGTGVQARDDAPPVATRSPPPFSVYDANRDGYLSADEFQMLRERRTVHHAARGRPVQTIPDTLSFEEIDRDHDLRISEAEMVFALQGLQSRGPGGKGPRYRGGRDREGRDGQ